MEAAWPITSTAASPTPSPNKAITILVLHVDTLKESMECVEKASAAEYISFRPKLHPSKRVLYHKGGVHYALKEGTQKKTKRGTAPCYDALAKALH